MRPASRGFGPRLFIRVRLRVYLPVDIGGALIGGVRHLRVFILIRTLPLKQKYIAQNPIHPSIVKICTIRVPIDMLVYRDILDSTIG